jgi:hypothetical protein
MNDQGCDNARNSSAKNSFCQAEWTAIEKHREKLVRELGHPVSLKKVLESWMQECSGGWREEYMRKAFQTQSQEILKHKWIESEKAGHDLGKAAIEDWIKKYADLWRRWWEEQQG